jgi:hypothetical protein
VRAHVVDDENWVSSRRESRIGVPVLKSEGAPEQVSMSTVPQHFENAAQHIANLLNSPETDSKTCFGKLFDFKTAPKILP